jgi:hypothetical protein
MPIRKYKPEQIVTLLRQVEVGLANGKTTLRACKDAEITAQTYYRWRKEFGGLKNAASAPAAMVPQMAALRSPTGPYDPPFASLPDEVVM